ncbi:hypothetical protein HDV63DRAFT_389963 [Trichoderma sp. SZMC 28014]
MAAMLATLSFSIAARVAVRLLIISSLEMVSPLSVTQALVAKVCSLAPYYQSLQAQCSARKQHTRPGRKDYSRGWRYSNSSNFCAL